MTTTLSHRQLRRRYVTSTVLIAATLIAPAGVSLAIAGDDVAETARNFGRDSVELSDDVDARYVERIDVVSVADASSGSNVRPSRHEVIYIDLVVRDDCTVTDRSSDHPALTCTRAPYPTEVAP